MSRFDNVSKPVDLISFSEEEKIGFIGYLFSDPKKFKRLVKSYDDFYNFVSLSGVFRAQNQDLNTALSQGGELFDYMIRLYCSRSKTLDRYPDEKVDRFLAGLFITKYKTIIAEIRASFEPLKLLSEFNEKA